MAASMKETLRTAKKMVKALSNGLMVQSTLEVGETINSMESVFIMMLKRTLKSKENGSMVKE
jgi:hypothetical protein